MPRPEMQAFRSDCPSLTVSQPAVRTCRFSPEGAVIFQTAEFAWLD